MVNSPNLARRRVPMSALVMPVEMDVLGPPPALSSSPLLGADFLSELQCAPWRPAPTCTSAAAAVGALAGQVAHMALSAPRPILASQRHHGNRLYRKKRVVFADDKGLALVQVIEHTEWETELETSTRLVTEPECRPLKWTLHEQPSMPALLPPAPERPRWTLASAQPVADFSRFCERLERDNVVLETAVCGTRQRAITGVIRVKNLGFEKRVFVRATSDAWRTSRDWSATYIAPISGVTGQAPLFDRFSFEVATPDVAVSDRLEFCVCFQCAAGEFWDNNGGENYVARRERAPDGAPKGAPRDVYREQADSEWAYFSSWEGATAEVPYW